MFTKSMLAAVMSVTLSYVAVPSAFSAPQTPEIAAAVKIEPAAYKTVTTKKVVVKKHGKRVTTVKKTTTGSRHHHYVKTPYYRYSYHYRPYHRTHCRSVVKIVTKKIHHRTVRTKQTVRICT